MFNECDRIKCLWSDLVQCFQNNLILLFKLYVYKSREKKLLNIDNLIAEIRKRKRIEK